MSLPPAIRAEVSVRLLSWYATSCFVPRSFSTFASSASTSSPPPQSRESDQKRALATVRTHVPYRHAVAALKCTYHLLFSLSLSLSWLLLLLHSNSQTATRKVFKSHVDAVLFLRILSTEHFLLPPPPPAMQLTSSRGQLT